MQPRFPILSRRQLIHTAGMSALALTTPSPRTRVQEKPLANALAPLNRFPRMVREWYVEQVRAAEKIGLDAQAALKTKADAEAYIEGVRKKIATCFGKFPEKTPLNAKVTGTLERDAYTHDREGDLREPGSS